METIGRMPRRLCCRASSAAADCSRQHSPWFLARTRTLSKSKQHTARRGRSEKILIVKPRKKLFSSFRFAAQNIDVCVRNSSPPASILATLCRRMHMTSTAVLQNKRGRSDHLAAFYI
ncbi:unnamed protein product [Ectocarpus sp. 8 AP-2014]